ncbi:dimethylaniline monooxygenase (N-oxide forming) [Corynespora cassiicola Philippines]|uniref:Dimethylaniline monooxygenase (N-oxide forming) n=1 Tax=Corynespora cassiicola Philippines TaxID=1448308 RepID=A0A2T2PA13_CORCC|nr:dimethylaniline monooxygenase (N-oxide forming) [Corynespora cassiicola Philippines]
MIQRFDLVIVGTGIHGLAVLKTYRDVNPTASILVLDKSETLGGVWARDRLYPGLRTNNHFHTFEYSDLPMDTHGYNPANDHIPGENVNEYLNQYALKFDLMRYMRFNWAVESATDEGHSGWTLKTTETQSGTKIFHMIKASKLVIATGLTSEPFIPIINGGEVFGAPTYHSSQFSIAENGLGPYKRVALLGGAKFSWDIACAYAAAGVQVNWIIRQSGHGPCWMMPNRLTPLKIKPELFIQTRLVSWLSPCIWGDADGFSLIRKFLHQNWLGRKIVDAFFGKMQHSVLEHNDYDSHPETAKLKPWDDVFYIGTNRGLLNYDLDFFQFVKDGTVRIHIADIKCLSRNTLHLSNGVDLKADVLICGTGWKESPQINFVTDRDLGLPGFTSSYVRKYTPHADAEIFQKCPRLNDQPGGNDCKSIPNGLAGYVDMPYRLYRFMVPPAFIESQTIAFAGAYRSLATTIIAQVQALWITAFFDCRISHLSHLDMENLLHTTSASYPGEIGLDLNAPANRILYETVLHTQFGKWRYSRGFGARFPEMLFDCLPYVDLLLKDVGVKNRRKDSWWKEIFTPYYPKDYRGILDEYMQNREQRANGTGLENNAEQYVQSEEID